MNRSMEIGDIVVSLAGHDKDKAFIITSVVSDKFVLIADGKARTLEHPKLKQKRHLRVTGKSDLPRPTNAALRKRIKQYLSERRLYAEE